MALLPVRARHEVVTDDLADRHPVDRQAPKISEVANGKLKVYPGTYEQFSRRRAHRAAGPAPAQAS